MTNLLLTTQSQAALQHLTEQKNLLKSQLSEKFSKIVAIENQHTLLKEEYFTLSKQLTKIDYDLALIDGRRTFIAHKKTVLPTSQVLKAPSHKDIAKMLSGLPDEQRRTMIEQLKIMISTDND